MSVRSGDLFDEFARVGNPQAVGAECTQPDDAEIRVAKHNRVRRAPLHVRELFGVYEINFGFDRRIEAVFPGTQFRKDRRVAAVDRVSARRKHVRDLPLKHKYRRLRFANDQLCAVLDLLPGKPETGKPT